MKLNENRAKSLVDNAIHEHIESIEQGLGDQLKLHLQTIGKFHHYSFHNTLLNALQRPDASHVVGFVTWKKLGSHIKQGRRG